MTTQAQRNLATEKWKARKYTEQCCVMCGLHNSRFPKTLCGVCNSRKSAQVRGRDLEWKIECFEAYGGVKCNCCEERGIFFLGLDHINNDGSKEPFSGKRLYSQLRKWGYPPGFRVLCHNCNLGRYLNGGKCPHELEAKNGQ